MLDNWDFTNPVNQKGLTEYPITTTANFFFIDRWSLPYVGSTATLTSSGISFTGQKTNDNAIKQVLENQEYLLGNWITASVLFILDGKTELLTASRKVDSFATNKYQHFEFKDADGVGQLIIACDYMVGNRINFWIYQEADYWNKQGLDVRPVTLVAAKLEVGKRQTLCQKNDEGIWELLCHSNKKEELVKCQHYQQIIGGDVSYMELPVAEVRSYNTSSKVWALKIPLTLATPMRGAPTVRVESKRGDNSFANVHYGPMLTSVKTDDVNFRFGLDIFPGSPQSNTHISLNFTFTFDDVNNLASTIHWLITWVAPNIHIILDANIA